MQWTDGIAAATSRVLLFSMGSVQDGYELNQTHVGDNCPLGASAVESFLTSGKTTAVVAIVYEQSFPQSILLCLLHLYISCGANCPAFLAAQQNCSCLNNYLGWSCHFLSLLHPLAAEQAV